MSEVSELSNVNFVLNVLNCGNLCSMVQDLFVFASRQDAELLRAVIPEVWKKWHRVAPQHRLQDATGCYRCYAVLVIVVAALVAVVLVQFRIKAASFSLQF